MHLDLIVWSDYQELKVGFGTLLIFISSLKYSVIVIDMIRCRIKTRMNRTGLLTKIAQLFIFLFFVIKFSPCATLKTPALPTPLAYMTTNSGFLHWITSFLTNRRQRVVIDGAYSAERKLYREFLGEQCLDPYTSCCTWTIFHPYSAQVPYVASSLITASCTWLSSVSQM